MEKKYRIVVYHRDDLVGMETPDLDAFMDFLLNALGNGNYAPNHIAVFDYQMDGEHWRELRMIQSKYWPKVPAPSSVPSSLASTYQAEQETIAAMKMAANHGIPFLPGNMTYNDYIDWLAEQQSLPTSAELDDHGLYP